MLRKTQRRIARQEKVVEEMWGGPTLVREQRAVSKVSIGHHGPGIRKVLLILMRVTSAAMTTSVMVVVMSARVVAAV